MRSLRNGAACSALHGEYRRRRRRGCSETRLALWLQTGRQWNCNALRREAESFEKAHCLNFSVEWPWRQARNWWNGPSCRPCVCGVVRAGFAIALYDTADPGCRPAAQQCLHGKGRRQGVANCSAGSLYFISKAPGPSFTTLQCRNGALTFLIMSLAALALWALQPSLLPLCVNRKSKMQSTAFHSCPFDGLVFFFSFSPGSFPLKCFCAPGLL